jgi:hypothetical protein
MSVIVLTTGFGARDGCIGTMKGAIWGFCPAAGARMGDEAGIRWSGQHEE